ncbi:unnamed protein product [Arctogadus glacialis]
MGWRCAPRPWLSPSLTALCPPSSVLQVALCSQTMALSQSNRPLSSVLQVALCSQTMALSQSDRPLSSVLRPAGGAVFPDHGSLPV